MPTGNLKGSATADDVALRAGVSRWTVTRAFKKDASISKASQAKVMAAAEELGYVPDLHAASLASTKSNLVALLVDDFSNPHKLVMMECLTSVLRQHGFDTLLVNTLDENDASRALLNVSQRRVDAAVLLGLRFDDDVLETALGAQRVKKLIIFARASANPNTVSICVDDGRAMEKIADYVVKRGYRRPVFVAGPQTASAHLMRKETFLSHWKSTHGETLECVSVDAYNPQIAYRRVTNLLQSRASSDRPDVLVCENDALAIGAIDAIRYRFGLQVPEEIAVTGFDDVPQAASPHYLLTTYRQPIQQMANALIQVLSGEADLTACAQFNGTLVVRESA